MKDKELDNLKQEVEENEIDKELHNVDPIWDKITSKPTGSFSKLSEVEKHLKRKKG